MITGNTLEKFLDQYLEVKKYSDYGPNGLQVKGSNKISKIAFAVSSSLDAINKAVAFGADALIVHHGLFWKGDLRPITGNHYLRIKALIEGKLNLFAYHLPLDGSLKVGHAKELAKLLKMEKVKPFGEHKGAFVGVWGNFKTPIHRNEVIKRLELILNRKINSTPTLKNNKIKSLGIITGGASSYWREAYDSGLDAFLTGEMREQDYHEASESQFHFFAGGHNATEEFGILALQKFLEKKYRVKTLFISSENPV